MPAEPIEAIQPSQDKDATTPTETTPTDQPTTQTTNDNADLRGIMQHLDIPDAVLERIAPKAEEKPEVVATPPVESEQPPAQPEPVEEKDDDEDEEAAAEAEQPPVEGEQPQKIDKRQKRINRLTRQKSELQTQLDNFAAENQKLREKLGQSKPEDQPAPLVGGRLPSIQQDIAKCDAILQWCDDNAEGGEFGEGDKATFYDAKTIKGWRRNAETSRQKHVVEEGKELDRLSAVRSQADQQAFQLWPEMFDKTKPEYQEAVSYIQRYPFLVNIPEANVALGLLVEGAKSLKAKSEKNGQVNGDKKHKDIDERAFTTPRVPIAPHTAEPPSRESRQSSTKKFNEAMSNLVKDQDNNDKWLAEAFGALDEQNRGAVTNKTPVKT